MFEGWGDFFLLAGSAAAVLIGLIFVVVSLMDDRPRSSVLYGSRLFMGPIVLHMSFVLVLSAAALAPRIDPRGFAAIVGLVALWGLARGVYSIVGIRRLGTDSHIHWTDVWFYGAVPTAIHLAMLPVAAACWQRAAWASYGVGTVIVALLLAGIRNEWDLVTWLAPRADGEGEGTL